MSIRVCIADDHLLILNGIMRALEAAEDIDVVGVTQRGDEVAALVEEQLPDLVLLDHRMPGTDGLSCLRLIKHAYPQIKVVMLSASEDASQIAEALAAGAHAYIGKRINPSDLASTLRQVVTGVVYQASPDFDLGAAADPEPPACELTDRELTMLDAISRGLSTKNISRELWISEKTVKFHLTNIYRKLGVHNRTGAMRYAFEHGLVATAPAAELVIATG
jgi:DNA-binding NarL/FixJ family response regulator